MTIQTEAPVETGAVIVVPLNKLKKSEKNAARPRTSPPTSKRWRPAWR